jgi:hypothetical protein
MDPDVVSLGEARLVGNSWWRKTIWMFFFSVSQACRPMKNEGNAFWDGFAFFNVAVVVAVNLAVLFVLGPIALVFLMLSTFFALGLHPLGGRWLQEHYVTRAGQETYSYYGAANIVAFNVGYHNEHHDFMSVAWHRLPKVRELGRDHYDTLKSYRSWTAVLLRFLFDPKLSAYSRSIPPRRDRAERSSRFGVSRMRDGPRARCVSRPHVHGVRRRRSCACIGIDAARGAGKPARASASGGHRRVVQWRLAWRSACAGRVARAVADRCPRDHLRPPTRLLRR